MPAPGEIVCYYTHEASDGSHRTIDAVGIVMVETDAWLDLKVIKPGIAPYDERAYYYEGPEYDEKGNLIQGRSYWRELGEEVPNFDAPLYRDPATVAVEEEPFVEEPAPVEASAKPKPLSLGGA